MRRGRVLDREAVREVGIRDHHARIEADEQGDDGSGDRRRGRKERPPLVPRAHEHDRGDDGDCGDGDGQDAREQALVVHVARDDERPDEKDGADDGGRRGEARRSVLGALAEVTERPQGEEDRAVEGEEQADATPARTEYTLNRSPKSPAKVWSEAIGTPWSRLANAMPHSSGTPNDAMVFSHAQARLPPGGLRLPAPLERQHANDEEGEDEKKSEVEAREHRRVPDREGRERRGARDHEPDLVPVPERADRLEHRPAVALAPAEDGEEHADAEVEALEHEVARPEEREQAEPEDLERHLSTRAPARAPLSSPSRRAAGGSSRA